MCVWKPVKQTNKIYIKRKLDFTQVHHQIIF